MSKYDGKKEKYHRPEMKVVLLEDDVIRTSGECQTDACVGYSVNICPTYGSVPEPCYEDCEDFPDIKDWPPIDI